MNYAAVQDYAQIESKILSFMQNESDSTFEELILQAHRFQKDHCPRIKNFCNSSCPDPQRWEDIPPIPTEAFKDPKYSITSFPVNLAVKTFLTSGTTGQTRGSHHFRNLLLYETSVRVAWRNLNLPELPFICLTQPPTIDPTSSLIHMFATLGGRFLINSSGTLDQSTITALLAANRKPFILAGTALSFLHLFKSAPSLPHLPEGSWALETGGYKGSGKEISKKQFYKLISEKLNLPDEQIINEYSMTELSSQFYTTGLENSHLGPHWLRARVIKPGSSEEVPEGQTGLLAIYDLANLGSSVSIMTDDLAQRKGDAFELLGRDTESIPRGCSRAADEMLSSQ